MLDVGIIMESFNFYSVFDILKKVEILFTLNKIEKTRSVLENSDLNPFLDFMEQDLSEVINTLIEILYQLRKK